MHQVVPSGVVRHFFDKLSSLFFDVGRCHSHIPLRPTQSAPNQWYDGTHPRATSINVSAGGAPMRRGFLGRVGIGVGHGQECRCHWRCCFGSCFGEDASSLRRDLGCLPGVEQSDGRGRRTRRGAAAVPGATRRRRSARHVYLCGPDSGRSLQHRGRGGVRVSLPRCSGSLAGLGDRCVPGAAVTVPLCPGSPRVLAGIALRVAVAASVPSRPRAGYRASGGSLWDIGCARPLLLAALDHPAGIRRALLVDRRAPDELAMQAPDPRRGGAGALSFVPWYVLQRETAEPSGR